MKDKVREVARRMSAERGGEERGSVYEPNPGRSTTQCLTCDDMSKCMYFCVAVTGRNPTLFCCIFQPCYYIQSCCADSSIKVGRGEGGGGGGGG